jgi:hypothetical protein
MYVVDPSSLPPFARTPSRYEYVCMSMHATPHERRTRRHLCIFASLHLCIFASLHLCIFASLHLCIFASLHLCIFASLHHASRHLGNHRLISPNLTHSFATSTSTISKDAGYLVTISSEQVAEAESSDLVRSHGVSAYPAGEAEFLGVRVPSTEEVGGQQRE